MPRSGSTWLYNVARLVLERGPDPVQAAWIAAYDPQDPAPVHLVKAHAPADVAMNPDLILTTWRPIPDCLLSLVRMGWLETDKRSVKARYRGQKTVYAHWAALSGHEVHYDDILHRPAKAVAGVAECLGVALSPEACDEIAAELTAMSAPKGGLDKHTLLHPGHRATVGESGEAKLSRQQLQEWMDELDLEDARKQQT